LGTLRMCEYGQIDRSWRREVEEKGGFIYMDKH
jgi:hypothetical protein